MPQLLPSRLARAVPNTSQRSPLPPRGFSHASQMPTPNFNDVRDRPLATDEQLVPFLQSMLEGSYRRQVWVMLLDAEARPLPVLIPMDVPAEPDPDEVVGLA